ncbi:MAG: peptidoglycan DD-metalloendopeptidase family protein [Candidatus Magasanikbacteria bacterium]
MIKKILFTSILFCGLLSVPFFVSADEQETNYTGGNTPEINTLNQEIEKKREKVKQLEESIAEYKEKIKEKKTEAVSLSNQMAILDNHIAQVELDIEATTEKVETIKLEIESLQLAIEDKESDIARQKAILAEFIRTLHQNEDRNIIEIMAAYDDFSEFYDQIQYLETIERDITQSHRSLNVAKTELEDKKEAGEERHVAYADIKDKLENKKQDLEEQVKYKEDLMIQTHASELTFKVLLSNLKKQYEGVEREIVGIEQEVRRRLEDQNKLDQPEVNFDGKLSWPTPSHYVTAYFHDPDYPYRHIFEHNAIDLRAGHGTPIRAAASGYVGRAKFCSTASCYSYIMLIHSGGLSTVYGHINNITVSADQFVTRGDIIGYSGGTPGTVGAGPFVTGPHLHFEVRKNGIPINPLSHLVKDY